MFSTFRSALTAVTLTLAVGLAHASPITLTYLNNLRDPADPAPSDPITGYSRVLAGEFDFRISGATPYWDDRLSAFCVQTDTVLRSPAEYTIETGLTAFGARAGLLESLFNQRYTESKESAQNSAAMQLAIWEIVNETGSALSLTGGAFTTGSFSGARTIAQGWLNGLNTAPSTASYEFFVLRSVNSQDLITVRPVPEPGTLLLLGAGLLGLGMARARRRRAG